MGMVIFRTRYDQILPIRSAVAAADVFFCCAPAAVNMHSGFSWLGTGAIVDKAAVVRFMEQLRYLNETDALLADMYFATWMNQVPYQLETTLVELEERFGFSSEQGGIARNMHHMVRF